MNNRVECIKSVKTKKGLEFKQGYFYKINCAIGGGVTIYANKYDNITLSTFYFDKYFKL